jgi:uncharacterized membrane protein YkvA (DUF1232 family)
MDTWVWIVIVVGLVAFLVMLIVVLRLVARLRNTWALLAGGPEVSAQDRFLFFGALAYAISPIDVLPDPILIDDIGVLLFALHSLRKSADRKGLTAATGAAMRIKSRYRAK